MKDLKLKIEYWPIEKLLPYARNPRKNDDAVDKGASFIKEFGFSVPVLVQSDGTIIDGHLRLKCAKRLDMKEVPVCVRDDMTSTQIKAFRLSVNRFSELADWDDDMLKLELIELDNMQYDVDLLGFDIDLEDEEEKQGMTDPDEVPEVEQNVFGVKRGDVWVLGDHRIMCGDSTSESDVAKLMDGKKADMVFTDPPYNHASDEKLVAQSIRQSMRKLSESKWDKNFDITKIFKSIETIKNQNSSVYVCTSWHFAGKIWDWMSIDSDHNSYCIWHKPNPMPSLMKRHWTWSSEIICYATYGKHIFNFPAEGHASNVWSINKNLKNDLHPTMKPIEVCEKAILHSSNQNQLIADLFLGSGSTIIACEKTGRQCYGMELDEHYFSVIIKRWQDFTGKTAIKEESNG